MTRLLAQWVALLLAGVLLVACEELDDVTDPPEEEAAGADDDGTAATRCEGPVDGDDVITATHGPDQEFWTANMRSLRVEIGLHFCGRALETERGEVIAPFALELDGDDLEMANDHGTFIWRRD